MQADKILRKKLSEEFLHPELVWSSDNVWKQINIKQKNKGPFFLRIAASVLLCFCLGLYFVIKEDKVIISHHQIKNVVISKKAPTLLNDKLEKNIQISRNNNFIPEKIISSTPSSIEEEILPSVSENSNKIESITTDLPISNIEKQILIDKNSVSNHTIVLNIPVEEEKQPVSKKRWVGRLKQQLVRYNREGKFNWEEINIRPRRVLIFVKNSFQENSTDSTNQNQ